MAAGQSKLNIVITAVDNATQTINRVNRQVAQLTRPFSQLSRSMQQFSRASGLSGVATQLGRVGRAASVVAKQITAAASHLAQIVGLGSAAALADIVVQWGKLGFEVDRTANALGVANYQLMGLQSVFRQNGLNADAAAAALKSMGDTLEDATYGRNTQALVMMRQLGIELHRTSGGAVDSHRALLDLATALNDPRFKGNRQAQAFAARMFGVESMLPILLQGRGAILAQEAESRRTGSTRDTSAADRFGAVLYRAQDAAAGLRNAIGDKLIPVLQPLLEQFIQWEIANKDIIGSKIADFVRGLVIEIPKIAKAIDDVAQAMGGWKNIIIAVGIVLTANMLAPTAILVIEISKLAVLTGGVAVKGILALGAAMGTTGTAAQLLGFGLARLSLLGASLGAGWMAGDWLSDWYTRRTGGTFGGDLFDSDHPNAGKASADFNAKFRRGGRGNYVERDPVTSAMAEQQEAIAKANEAAASSPYRTAPGSAPAVVPRSEQGHVHVYIHDNVTRATTKGPVSATVYHSMASADLP